jgi:hypothetical protein
MYCPDYICAVFLVAKQKKMTVMARSASDSSTTANTLRPLTVWSPGWPCTMLYTGNYHTMARTVVLRVIIMLTSGDYKFAGWVAVCRQFEQTPSPMQDIARYNFRGGSGLPITNRILKQLAEGGDVDDVLDGLNTSLSTTTSYDEE